MRMKIKMRVGTEKVSAPFIVYAYLRECME